MGLYLNFVKKVTCILQQYYGNLTPVCRINCQREVNGALKRWMNNIVKGTLLLYTLQKQGIFSRQNKK